MYYSVIFTRNNALLVFCSLFFTPSVPTPGTTILLYYKLKFSVHPTEKHGQKSKLEKSNNQLRLLVNCYLQQLECNISNIFRTGLPKNAINESRRKIV